MKKERMRLLLMEFFRYVVVGGIAFAVDFGTLWLCQEFFLPDWGGSQLYVAAALGFLTGLAANYALSLVFVFRSEKDRKRGLTVRAFLLYAVIGLFGLLLTELGMYLGADLLQIHYLIVKVVVAGLVLIYNYVARKVLIFR